MCNSHGWWRITAEAHRVCDAFESTLTVASVHSLCLHESQILRRIICCMDVKVGSR